MVRSSLAAGLLLFCACSQQKPPDDSAEQTLRYKVVRPTITFEILHDAPNCLIVDLREPEAFDGPLGHLAHSRNIPLARLEATLPELEAYKDSTFIVLCHQKGSCSTEGMELFARNGFRYAILMEDGIEGWIDAGYGTVVSNPD